MTQPVHAGATAVLCHYCGGSVLTWSPDHWLAAHEQVFKCGSCGRMTEGQSIRGNAAAAPVLHPVRLRH